MNRHQRRVLIAVAITVLAMLLYPPFSQGVRSNLTSTYDWLFGLHHGAVNVELLFAQWFAVGVVGAIAYFLCMDRKP